MEKHSHLQEALPLIDKFSLDLLLFNQTYCIKIYCCFEHQKYKNVVVNENFHLQNSKV